MRSMRVMLLPAPGPATAFIPSTLPIPQPGPGQALVRVLATSVNPIDCKIRAGAVPALTPAFPCVLHGDVSGTVSALGSGVHHISVGQAVFGCAGGFSGLHGGALSEYLLCDARLLCLAPQGLPLADCAALPLCGMTALLMRERAQELDGLEVLIHGASGGVGFLLCQIAQAAGAHVSAIVSSPEKAAALQPLHLKHVHVGRAPSAGIPEFSGAFTTVFDTIGGDSLSAALQHVAVHGQVITCAARGQQDLSPLHAKGAAIDAVFQPRFILDPSLRETTSWMLGELADLVEEGLLKPCICAQHYSLESVAEAHALCESGSALGKIIISNS